MASTRVTTSDKSLDDSLTNIQWLCGLESSELLHSRENSAEGSSRDSINNVITPNSPNPYPKPPYSYATMILLAINSTEDKRMTLQDIYKWIENNYPYYKKCKKAWKNSIRHNLSLHSFFLKEKRPLNLPGKGSYWSISPEGKKNIMQEVMKHAQPVVQNPLALQSRLIVGQNLRPILPKPCDNINSQQHYSNSDGRVAPTLPGVCSLVNGDTIMPVVILPTNVYVALASKIASGKKINGSSFAVTQREDSSIHISEDSKVPVPERHVDQSKAMCNNTFVDPAYSALMEEILKNENFSEALDAIKKENDDSEITTISVRDDHDYKPAFKKVKIKKEKENKELDLQPYTSAQGMPSRTPLKDRTLPTLAAMNCTSGQGIPSSSPLKGTTLPTLAAMNCGHQESGNFFDKDCKQLHDFNSMFLSPVQLSIPKEPVITLKMSTPAQSTSPLSTSTFHSGLTPLKYDSDSGFFTPLKDSDFDFLLSPNHLNLALTPARKNGNSTPQGCRKSLKLGALQEEDAADGISWM